MLATKSIWKNFPPIFRDSWKKVLLVISISVILIFTYNLQTLEIEEFSSLQLDQITSIKIKKVAYLINTSQCKIPEDDPFNEDVIDFLEEEKSYKCSDYELLTYIDKTHDVVTLNVNQSLLETYSKYSIQCCYSNITRVHYQIKADNEFKLTECIPFEDSVVLTYPYVQVECKNKFFKVYKNVHATTLPVPRRTVEYPEEPKFSVLLLGIDSMSKSNIQRTMPKTYRFAEKNFHNLRGYNKIGENTFPNLMALLTGYNMSQLEDICNNSVKMNNCKFIWDKFRDSGYITAYAEDECAITTFNWDRPGFLAEPTDFYYHSYFLAAEKLGVKKRHDMTYCAGVETSGDRLINAAKDFAISFKNVPTFGVFWANSFSHDNVNMPSVMDESYFKLFSDPEFMSSLENTVLVFFSDHGFRFGELRYTHSGWLEERLPFMYVRLPNKFHSLYNYKYRNFLTNAERLTVPYDLYNTLEDILEIGNSSYRKSYSRGCRECLSLFSAVPENRTCEQADIEQHWCTCKGHTYVDPNTPLVRLVSHFVINETNKLIKKLPQGELCSVYTLRKVRSAGVSEPYVNLQNQTVNYYLVIVKTAPPAIFEATVEASVSGNERYFNLLGGIGRIDRYSPVTSCVRNGPVKKYCYCASKSFTEIIKSIFF